MPTMRAPPCSLGDPWATILFCRIPDLLRRERPPPPIQGGQLALPRTTLLVIWPQSLPVKASVAMPLWLKRQLSIVPPQRCWTALLSEFTKMHLRIVDRPAPLFMLL